MILQDVWNQLGSITTKRNYSSCTQCIFLFKKEEKKMWEIWIQNFKRSLQLNVMKLSSSVSWAAME